MGRFDASWPQAERAIHLAREHQIPENLGWALLISSIVANFARRTSRVPVMEVRRACVEGFEIAEAGGALYSQIAASFALAVAEFLSGDYQDSGERLIATLERARTAGTGLDHHGYYRAVLAETFLARGEVDTAIASAREAVQVADAGGTWFYAALARAVLVDALAQANAEEDTIVAIIAEARELVRKSGGDSLLPRLREAEVRLLSGSDHAALVTGLREAEAMYSAMGASDPAERLAREIGTCSAMDLSVPCADSHGCRGKSYTRIENVGIYSFGAPRGRYRGQLKRPLPTPKRSSLLSVDTIPRIRHQRAG